MTPNVTSSINISINFSTPAFVYNLPKPIRSAIFNFNKVTSEINIGEFLSGPSYFPCNCSKLTYVDKNICYIVTGDLRDLRLIKKIRYLNYFVT